MRHTSHHQPCMPDASHLLQNFTGHKSTLPARISLFSCIKFMTSQRHFTSVGWMKLGTKMSVMHLVYSTQKTIRRTNIVKIFVHKQNSCHFAPQNFFCANFTFIIFFSQQLFILLHKHTKTRILQSFCAVFALFFCSFTKSQKKVT